MTDNPKNSFSIVLHRSQVGHCSSRESFKRQQKLQKAIKQARKLVKKSPTRGTNKGTSSIMAPKRTVSSLMKLLNDITEETDQCSEQHSKNPVTEGELQDLTLLCYYYHRTTLIIHLILNGCLIFPLRIENKILV